jgi:hypothetical protein
MDGSDQRLALRAMAAAEAGSPTAAASSFPLQFGLAARAVSLRGAVWLVLLDPGAPEAERSSPSALQA